MFHRFKYVEFFHMQTLADECSLYGSFSRDYFCAMADTAASFCAAYIPGVKLSWRAYLNCSMKIMHIDAFYVVYVYSSKRLCAYSTQTGQGVDAN